MSTSAKRITRPQCEKELTRIGYTEHGTKELQERPSPQSWRNKWEEVEAGGDCAFYCLECNHEFEIEELEKAGII